MDGEWTEGDRAGQRRDGAIDLPQLFRAVARRKWWIIVTTCVAFALALAIVIVLPPRYTGVAKVLLENQESYYTRPDKAVAEQVPNLDPEAVQSEAETITSPDLARKAIAKLDLANRPEFNQAASTNPLSIALSMMGLSGSASVQSGEARIVDAFLSRLTAFPVSKTRVLQIEFVSQDSELAARGANVVAQLFLESEESAKKDAAKAASAWLASKIDELRGKVAETDSKVENYRAQSGLLAGGNNMTLPAARRFEYPIGGGPFGPIGRVGQGAAFALDAAGRADLRRAGSGQGRIFAALRRRARHHEGADRLGGSHAAARPSPYEGIGGATGRPRQRNTPGRRQGGAWAGE